MSPALNYGKGGSIYSLFMISANFDEPSSQKEYERMEVGGAEIIGTI